MKKTCGIFLVVMFAVLMTACGNGSASDAGNRITNSENSLPDNLVMLDAGEWPQNEYIASIPQPESGTVSQGWIDPDVDLCYVDMTDVSREAMENWYSLLLESGFTEVEKIVEESMGQHYTSTNALLQKDGIYVSMTHLSTDEGHLGLCITREK